MIVDQPMLLTIPAITPEQLYLQDKRRRKWDKEQKEITLYLESLSWYREKRLQQIEVELVRLEERQRRLVDERRQLTKERYS